MAEPLNITSPAAAFARQARMEVRVERALMGVTRAFLAEVEAMALAEGTYLSPAVVAARWEALTTPDALAARSLPAPVAAYVAASLAESSVPDDAYGTAMAVLTAANEGAWSAELTSDVLGEAFSMDTPPQEVALTAAAPRRDSRRGKAMTAAFDKALNGTGRISWGAAARRDARTAVTGLDGLMSTGEMRNAGVPTKMWVTRRDERVRHTHSDADGQTVPLDQPFTVGGYSLMHPGDRSAPARETVNCRCVTVAGASPEPASAALSRNEDDNAAWLDEQWEAFGEAEGDAYGTGSSADRAFQAFGRYQDRDHRIVNSALRKGNLGPTAQGMVDDIDRLFAERGVRTPQAIQAYRGGAAPMLRGAKVGDVVSDPAYLSTTVRESAARPFGKVVEVEVPAGTKFLPGHASEAEMVLPRGARLEVLSVDPPRVRIVV